MAGIKITGLFIPNDPLDTYPLHEDTYFLGGLRVVNDITERDAISTLRRKWGMLVYVISEDTIYKLVDNDGDLSNNSNWEEFIGGGSSRGQSDNVTISQLQRRKVGTDDNFFDLVNNTWQISYTDDGNFLYQTISNGIFVYNPSDTYIWTHNSPDHSGLPDIEAGDYEIYTNINTPLVITDDSSTTYTATVVSESGLYKQTFSLPANIKLVTLGLSSPLTDPFLVWLIDRSDDKYYCTHKIRNINFIIDDDYESIDGSNMPMSDPHTELVTRAYVDQEIQDHARVDNVTIEYGTHDPYELGEGSTITELIQDSWESVINTPWSTGGTISSNTLSLPAGEDTIAEDSSGMSSFPVWDAGVYRFYCNMDLVPLGCKIYPDAGNGGNEIAFTSTLDFNGLYLHEVTLPAGFDTIGIYLDTPIPSGQTATINFIKRGSYFGQLEDAIKILGIDHIIDDDLRSIDSSHAPMYNAHKELVTRAYIQANTGVKLITYSELKDLYDNANLQAGLFYKITDYQHNNWLDQNHSEGLYTVSNYPIVVYASANDRLSWIGIDPQALNDLIIYDIENTINATAYQNRMGTGQVRDENGTEIVDSNIVNQITDDHTWVLGTALTVDLDNLSVTTQSGTYDGSHFSWDESTGTLTSDPFVNLRGSGFFWTTSINSGLKYKDPTRVTGKIIYRHDYDRNIKGDIDWRLAHFIRYETNTSSSPFYSTDVDLLAYEPTGPLNVGIDHENNDIYLDLSGTGNKNIYPMIPDLDKTKVRDIKFQHCDFIVLTTVPDSSVGEIKKIEFKDVTNFTNTYGSIRDIYLENVNNYYNLGYMTTWKLKSPSGTSENAVMWGNCGYFDMEGEVTQQSFGSISKLVFRGYSFYKVGFNPTRSYRSLEFYCDQVQNTRFKDLAWYNRIQAQRFNTIVIEGQFRDNEIRMSGYMQICTFDGDVLNNKIYCRGNFTNINVTGNFNNNIFDVAEYEYVDFQNGIINSRIEFSSTGSFSNHITESDHIDNNLINVSSNKTLTNIPLVYALDTSSSSFSLELPPNPTENLTLIFMDVMGNANANNVTINVSSSPNAGIVNTINGGTSYDIVKNYGFLELRYNSIGGWIVMIESQATITPDDITIELSTGNILTIKNINYIIDDDYESIDGSDTPMSDPHTELVTRAYVDQEIHARTYHWKFTTDDINIYRNICLKRDILRIKENVTIYVNGVRLNDSDWDFYTRREYPQSQVTGLDLNTVYTQHIQFNPVPSSGQTLEIIYKEYPLPTRYNLYLYRNDNDTIRPKMIPLQANIFEDDYYLSNLSVNDMFSVDATYTLLSDLSTTYTIEKRFPNVFRVKQFNAGYDLYSNENLLIECWVERPRRGGKHSGYDTGHDWDTLPILSKVFRYNEINLEDAFFKTGKKYRFRLLNPDTKTVTEFFEGVLSLKKISLFYTDPTLSVKTYAGFVKSAKIGYEY